MRIEVNGQPHDAPGSAISYREVVRLAGMTGSPSVTYSGPLDGDYRRGGIMYPGCALVVICDGLVFEICHTGVA